MDRVEMLNSLPVQTLGSFRKASTATGITAAWAIKYDLRDL